MCVCINIFYENVRVPGPYNFWTQCHRFTRSLRGRKTQQPLPAEHPWGIWDGPPVSQRGIPGTRALRAIPMLVDSVEEATTKAQSKS